MERLKVGLDKSSGMYVCVSSALEGPMGVVVAVDEHINVRLMGVHDAADYSVLWVVIVTSAWEDGGKARRVRTKVDPVRW